MMIPISVRQLLLNADNAAGRYFRLKLPAFIHEKFLENGTGAYTSEEWSKTRSLGYRNAGVESRDLDEDDRYLSRMFKAQYTNFLSAQRLARTFDFGSYESVLELGSGEMVQALVVTRLYPHLRYKATDFDPYVIDKCSKLSLLSGIEKGIIDVAQLKAEDLQGFQLVLSWELVYALDKEKLTSLFDAVGKAGVPMLVCTSQLAGPLRAALRRIKGIAGEDTSTKLPGLRMHGWNHSLGYYRQLAKGFGIELKQVWYPFFSPQGLDNFTYLLFNPITR